MPDDSNSDEQGNVSKVINALLGLLVLAVGVWFMGDALGILMIGPV